ncbi:YDG domain-containing protein [Pedobacter glucosidilyticus]|uniref:YDG domain-containing protein n=1 Tax=Pedobacter glucosidilyticus TaxID=1122941 RepID=UPI0026EE0B10|nr:YDG domain-containing protein [Pedobacter glucosidilyticus]
MKTHLPLNKISLLLALLLTFLVNTVKAQSLSAGDILFTGYDSTPLASAGDSFSFILLSNIPSGTKISFTDRGYTSSGWQAAGSTESTITWTSNSAIAMGTEVYIVGLVASTYNSSTSTSTTNGTVALTEGSSTNGLSLSNVGDQLIAFQSSDGKITGSSLVIIAGINYFYTAASTTADWNIGATPGPNSSLMPPGLTGGTSAFYTGPVTGITLAQSGKFKCSAVPATLNAANIRTAVMNSSNWDLSTTSLGTNSSCNLVIPSNTAPTLSTSAVTAITATGATFSGNVTADGGATVTERGFVYATTTNPTTANTKVQDGTGTGAFTEPITGLTAGTTYYVRAYAINSVGTSYGSEVSFATASNTEDCTINSKVSSVDDLAQGYEFFSQSFTACANGKINTIKLLTSASSSFYPVSTVTMTIREGNGLSGSILRTINIPTSLFKEAAGLEDYVTIDLSSENVLVSSGNQYTFGFEGNLSNRVQIYYSNNNPSASIYNGGQLYFGGAAVAARDLIFVMEIGPVTMAVIPTLTTSSATSITATGATFSGNVTADGGATVTERGFVYGTATNPTTANTKVQDGTGTGTFTEAVTGLTASTTYYVRAYATNSAGTSYGNQMSFTTLASTLSPSYEFFEGTTAAAQTFTNTTTGLNFTLTNKLAVQNYAGYGVQASNTPSPTVGSNFYIGNDSNTGTNQVNSIKSTNKTLFSVKSMWVYPSSNASGASPTNNGTITFTGKKNGVIQYTFTKSGIFQTAVNLGTNYNGFTLVDFSVGTDNSNTLIDEIEINLGSVYQYIAIDNIAFSATPSITNTTATAVTSTTATLNANVNPSASATSAISFDYSTSPTLASGVTNIAATPATLVSSNNATAVSVNISGLTAGTTYYYRAKATNAVGTNDNSQILSFATLAANTAPTVTTAATTAITATGVTFSGNVTADGGATVTERGFVYGTATNPTTANTKVQDGTGTGDFTEAITGLTASTTYYVRAYAVNSVGTSYGNEVSFTTTSPPCTGTITIGATASGAAYTINNGVLTTAGDATVPASVILNYLQNTGNLSIQSCNGNILIAANISGALSTPRTLTLKAAGDIIFNTGSSIVVSGNALNTILWSDADKNKTGSIYLNESTITTNGGHLWMGGGNQSATAWNGLAVGDGSAYANAVHAFTTNNFKNGITFYKSSVNTGAGNLAVSGIADGVSGVANGYNGVYLEQSSLVSTSGDIDLKAISTGTNNDASWHYGLLMGTVDNNTTAAIASTSGKVTILGETDFSEQTHGAGVGLYSFGNANSTVRIRTVSGAIDITGRLKSTGYNNQYGGIFLFGGGQEQIVSQTGKINLEGTSVNPNVAGINQWPGNTNSAIGFDGTNPFSGDITFNSNTFINYAGIITANNLELLGAGVIYDFSNSGNNINSLTANTGTVKYLDSNALTLESINATGEIAIATDEGNLTLAANLTTTSTTSDAIILNAGKGQSIGTGTGGNILVSGTPTISTGLNGIVKLFSGSENGSTGLTALAGGASNTRMKVDETTTTFSPALLAGNTYALYRVQTKIDLTVSNQDLVKSKTYDGTASATVSNIGLSGIEPGDDVTVTAAATYQNKLAGTGKTITVVYTLGGTDASKYTAPANLIVNDGIILKKELTVSGLSAGNKVYDATNAATVSGTASLTGVESGDNVALSGTPTHTFANANVGSAIAIATTGYTLNGTDAANYTILQPTFTANITARTLAVTATATNKVYDGTTTATVTFSDNRLIGDVFTVANTAATFDNKNVGSNKTVSISGISISGAAAGNYSVNTSTTTTAAITARTLIVTATAANKEYDGTTTATVTLADNRVNGDVFTTANTTATFNNKNVGNNKTVSISGISISGTDALNYTVNTSTTTTAAITARTLAVTATATDKTYDGTTIATVTLADNRVNGDILTTANTTATFNNKNVGSNKTVSIAGISISGTDAGNYTVNTTTTATADITARTLAVTATATNKTYDGTTTATVTFSDNRVSGDVLTATYTTAKFDNKNVGTGKAVSVSGISISGTDAGNYTANATASTTAAITAKPLTVTATGINKEYDANTTATVTLSDNRINGDVLTTAYTAATFNNKNVGTGKAVSVSGISISGTDASNYTVNTSTTTTAAITAKLLTVTATGINKEYDANTTATVTLGDNRITGDVLTAAYTTATFNDKNVGTGKAISVSGISISGTDAGNYTVNTTASTIANITAKALLISATGINKEYDANNTATVSLGDNRITGDVLTAAYTTATFDNKNVGTGKAVSVSGITISGADAGNYTANTTTTTTAAITAKLLTVSATGINKEYDANNTATVSLEDNRITGDVLTAAYTTATFNNKNVGTGKSVAVSGISISGTDAGNYTVNTTASTTANITAKALLVSATGINKEYDANTTATVSLGDNRIAGDVFTAAYTTATFNNKNVGTGKAVSVSGISIGGTDAGNYTVNASTSTTAAITAKALLVTATGINKEYDANNTATVTLSDNRITGDVLTAAYTTATFDNKNVGNNKTVSISGISISGTDAGNYTVNTTTSTTAAITRKALTIIADNKEKFEGEVNPLLTISYTGFVGGENNTVLTSQPIISTTATVSSLQGDYPITVSGAVSENYAISYQNGILTVKPGAPTSVSLAGVTLYENRASGTLAGTLSSTSNSPVATFTYSLVAGSGATDNASFVISGNQLQTAVSLNYENKQSYSVRVRSTTQFGFSLDEVLTVNLSDVNEAPTINAVNNQTICYTAAEQVIGLTGITAGPEVGQTTTVTASSSNSSLLSNLSVVNNELRYRVGNGQSGSTTISVRVRDNGGVANGGVDETTRSFTLVVNALPQITIISDKGLSISKGETAELTARGGTSYQWSNAGGIISGQNTATLTVRPEVSTTYTVSVTNASGCESVETINIEVREDYQAIKAENFMTPNGDGINDKWVVENIDVYPNHTLTIFDRSGRVLYEVRNYQNDWDGMLNGSPLAAGTYYYVFKFQQAGIAPKKGFITVVKQ